MIRWCAYCQTYQGESPPFDVYAMTHTICRRCVERAMHLLDDPETAIAPIRELFARLATRPREVSPRSLLADGERLGLAPLDLLVGILQPVLYEVGERWSRGETSIADEHAISRACSVAVDLLLEGRPDVAAKRQVARPDVLLVCAPGNMHSVGLQLVELYLVTEGISVFTVLPGVPVDEILTLVRSLEPRLLGLSVAMPEHVASACEVANRVHALPVPRRPQVVIGGFASRRDLELPTGTPARVCADFRKLPEMLAPPP